VESYDPALDQWFTLAPMPAPRHSLGAAECNGKIYAMGGQDVTAYLATVEEFTPP
jgi:hypothetical protein